MLIRKMIPYGRQTINDEDIAAVVDVLRSDWLTQGPNITRFEKALVDYCQVQYAVACSNATAALHVACLALNIAKGDIVWTSTNTFLSSANCARFCGADVDFVDIDARTYNLCPIKLEEKLLLAQKSGRLPKAVIPVHFAGQSCDMKAIRDLSKRFGFYVIEDASHAIGAQYKQQKVGDCNYSDITVFSFHPVKIITAGEGGVALTNSRELADKMRLLITHGMTRDREKMMNPTEDAWYYEQTDLGFNYRITDMQCALAASQLNRLDQFIKKRHELVNRYNAVFKKFPLIIPHQSPDAYSSFHLYVVGLSPEYQKKSRAQVFAELRQANVGVNVHYIPVHTQPYYKKLGFSWGDFPIAENYYQRAITLPLYPNLPEQDQDYIIHTVEDILK